MTQAKYKAKDLRGKWVYGTPIETRPDLKFGFHKWWMIKSAYSHGGYFYISQRKPIKEEFEEITTPFNSLVNKAQQILTK